MKAHYENFDSMFGLQHRISVNTESSQYLMDFNNAVVFQATLESAIESCRLAIEKEKERMQKAAPVQQTTTAVQNEKWYEGKLNEHHEL